jgi:hypothetical protein
MARMPSTRSQPLNPQVTGLAGSPVPAGGWPSRWPRPAAAPPRTAEAPPETQAEAVTAATAAAAARSGGFHESSYELQLGLEVSESEWPDDTTIPGALGER